MSLDSVPDHLGKRDPLRACRSAELFEQTTARGLELEHQRATKLRVKLLDAQRRSPAAIDVAISGLEAAERSGDP